MANCRPSSRGDNSHTPPFQQAIICGRHIDDHDPGGFIAARCRPPERDAFSGMGLPWGFGPKRPAARPEFPTFSGTRSDGGATLRRDSPSALGGTYCVTYLLKLQMLAGKGDWLRAPRRPKCPRKRGGTVPVPFSCGPTGNRLARRKKGDRHRATFLIFRGFLVNSARSQSPFFATPVFSLSNLDMAWRREFVRFREVSVHLGAIPVRGRTVSQHVRG